MSLSRCITCQDVCVPQFILQNACYHNIKWTLQICCHVIVTQSRPTVEQSACGFRNPSLQVKERTRVNCKLITAWRYNCERDSCAARVSYLQKKLSLQEFISKFFRNSKLFFVNPVRTAVQETKLWKGELWEQLYRQFATNLAHDNSQPVDVFILSCNQTL